MKNMIGFIVVAALGLLLTACGGGDGGGSSPSLLSIAVTPANPSVPVGGFLRFSAIGTYSDNTAQGLLVDWSSSNNGVATVSNGPRGFNGFASGNATGTATITATSGSVSGSTLLTVTSAAVVWIDVTPSGPSVLLGAAQQFTATGTYSDGSSQDVTTLVTWFSSDPGVATVSNTSGSKGLATSVGGGITRITASLGNVSGATELAVMSSSATRSSSNTGVATVRNTLVLSEMKPIEHRSETSDLYGSAPKAGTPPVVTT